MLSVFPGCQVEVFAFGPFQPPNWRATVIICVALFDCFGVSISSLDLPSKCMWKLFLQRWNAARNRNAEFPPLTALQCGTRASRSSSWHTSKFYSREVTKIHPFCLAASLCQDLTLSLSYCEIIQNMLFAVTLSCVSKIDELVSGMASAQHWRNSLFSWRISAENFFNNEIFPDTTVIVCVDFIA